MKGGGQMEQKIHINLMKLRGLIVERGFNITRLARSCGIAYGSMSRMLNGHFEPGYHFICMLIQALKMSQQEIMDVFFVHDD